MAALVKLLSERGIPLGEIVFARSFFALIPVVIWASRTGELWTVYYTTRPWAHVTRSVIGLCGIFFGFAALTLLPLADATAIGFTAPLITVVLAVVILHEQVRIYRWSAVVIGFIGVLIIVSGYAEEGGAADRSLMGAVFQLAAAGVVSLVVVQIRRMSITESAATIVVYFSSISALVALATIPFGWVVPSLTDAALLLATGILGGFAQVTLTESVRNSDASLLAPFDYLSLLWALGLGLLVFGNLPTQTMLAGSAIVVATGLFVIYRERQLRISSRNASELPPVIPGN